MNRDRNLDELIGADTTGAERERLQRAHDMLLEAGPPPELSPKLEEGPTLGMTLSKRRAVKRRAMLLLAAALAIVGVFLAGYAVANRGGRARLPPSSPSPSRAPSSRPTLRPRSRSGSPTPATGR